MSPEHPVRKSLARVSDAWGRLRGDAAWWERAAVLAGVVALCSYLGRILQAVTLRHVDEDECIFWHGAQDYAHLQFHEPRFYGQDYNALVDSAVAAPLVLVGFPVHVVIPLCTAALAALPWLLLCLCAVRQQRPLMGALLACVPLLLHVDFALFSAMPRGFFSGIAVASCAVPLAVLGTPSPARAAAAAFIVGLAASIGPGSLLLGGPLLLHLLLRRPYSWRVLGGVALGMVVAALLHRAAAGFYADHPENVVFKLGELKVEKALWDKGWNQLDLHFKSIAPRMYLDGRAVPRAALLLVLLSLFTRRISVILPALAIAVGPVLALAVSKAHSGHAGSLFLPHARLFLGVPVAFAAVAVMIGTAATPRHGHRGWSALALVLVAAISADAHAKVGPALEARLAGSPYQVPHRKKDWLLRACEREMALYREHRAEVAIHVEHNAPAYGCSALYWGELSTLFPQSERRTWRWKEESSASRSRLLLVHAGGACGPLLAHGAEKCERVNADPPIDLVVFPAPVPLRATLVAAGFQWR